MLFFDITEDDIALIKAAEEVIDKNYDNGAFYHTVSAALRCSDGKIYSGVNCDGIHGSCAEIVTIGTAYSDGERHFDTIVAVRKNTPDEVVSPCGNCRQIMSEYCPDIKVILKDENGKLIKVSARDLLPFAYTELA